MPPSPPDLPRYRCLHLLGEGAMGQVWAATDTELGTAVAVKLPKGPAGGPAALRLEREARVLARLDHPGIVRLCGRSRAADGRPVLVMSRAPGPDLLGWGAGGPTGAAPPTLGARLAAGRRLVAAVAHAHARGVVHRDLKPANVRVGPDGDVVVLDWGLACLVDGAAAVPDVALTRAGARVGTPAWMSPEQAAGETVGPEADVWALGVLLWELLSGRRAYEDGASTAVLAAVLAGPPPALGALAPAVPPAVAAVVMGCLVPRAARHADAGALGQALDAARSAGAGPRPAGGPWGAGVLALVGALGLAGALVVAAGGPGAAPPAAPSAPVLASGAALGALRAAGDGRGLAQASCARLAQDPDDAWGRGGRAVALPAARRLWSVPHGGCAQGQALGWDARQHLCLDAEQATLRSLGEDGAPVRWTRADELDAPAFLGKTVVVARNRHSGQGRRFAASDGRPLSNPGPLLSQSEPVPSRSAAVGRGWREDQALRDHWWRPGAASDPLRVAPPQRETAAVALRPRDALVLADGRELWLDDTALELRDFGGPVLARWPLPAAAGPPLGVVVSGDEAQVLLHTATGATVLSRETGRWSPWAPLPAVQALALGPAGEWAAAVVGETTVVWSVASPAARLVVPVAGAALGFAAPDRLVVAGDETLDMFALPLAELAPAAQLADAVAGLAWDPAGLVAWDAAGGALWPSAGGPPAPLGPVVDAASGPGGLALALGAGGLALRPPGGVPTPLSAAPCRWVAWAGPDAVVCARREDGPDRHPLDGGTADRSAALADQGWRSLAGAGGMLALVDHTGGLFELGPTGLHQRPELPAGSQALPVPGTERVLVDGREGLAEVDWRAPGAAVVDRLALAGRPRALAVAPDGGAVAVATAAGGLLVAGRAPLRVRWQVDGGLGSITALAWSPDGRRLAAGTAAGTVWTWPAAPPPCGAEGP